MLATLCGGTDTVLVPTNAVWKYLDNGSNQGTSWVAPGFSDAAWSNGPAPLGYGRAWIVTTNSYGPDSNNKYITTYYRHTFTVTNAAAFATLTLRLMRDDGAIVYLNGAEVRRDLMLGESVGYLTKASVTVSGSAESNYFETARSTGPLVTGTNVLAVEIHQVQTNSSDICFALALIGSDVPAPVNLLRRPYLQSGTITSICILAECDSDTALTVQYGSTTNYGNTAQTSFADYTTGGTFLHVVNITGLQPDTLYHYRVQASNTNWTDKTFHTLVPPGTDFRFAWMADCRTGVAVHDMISVAIKNTGPLLSLYGGDLCNSGNYADFTNEFLRPAELLLDATVPFYNVPGNHEGWGRNTKAFTENPSALSGTQDYYSFDCGDLHVLAINNQIADSPGSAQFTFATNDLTTTRQPWKIVTSHEPAYCFGGHTPNADMQAMVADKGVDLVLSGHAHYYERLFTNGVRQLVVGAAGAPLANVGIVGVDPGLEVAVKTNCYAVADVTYTSLHVVVYNEVGDVLDSVHLTKPPAPWQLAFTTPPTNVHAGATMLPAISVEVRDVKANLLTTASNLVTIALASNPGGSVLSGTLSVSASNGVATFNDLRLDQPAQAYTLMASAGSLAGTTSSAFNVWFADANGNDIADNWETDFFGGTNTVTGATSADPDGDGRMNLLEFVAGSNPTNGDSAFNLSITNVNGQALVSFTARQASASYHAGFDRHFSLMARTNLTSGSWSAVPGFDDIIGANQTVTCTNVGTSLLFFRLKAWLQPK
jgi:hypothetical protein